MPASQMTSMNCRPPRAIEPSRLARFPAQNARMRNSPIRNIGSATFVSKTQKMASRAAPPARPASTSGAPQLVGALP